LLGHHGALLLFTAVVLGGLSFLNTWDVLIHLFVIVGAFTLAQWRTSGRWRSEILRQSLTLGLILVVMAIVLYLPFYLGLRSQAAPPYLLPMIMRPTRLAHFLIIFGMPLVAVTVLVAALLSWMISHRDKDNPERTWLTAVFLVVGLVVVLLLLMLFLGWLIASNPDGMNVLSSTAAELGLNLPAAPFDASAAGRFGWAFSALAAFAPQLLEARITQPALILFLGGLLTAVVYLVLRMLQPHSEQLDEEWPQVNSPMLVFVLLMIATATLLALGPEFVYLRDNFGQRINTIFKFYYQAWILFGVAALFGLAYMIRRFRITGYIATALYMVLLAGSLLFPYYAIQSRAVEYRGPVDAEQRRAATLDGLEYVRLGNPDEFDAIMWLRENIVGSPVILEAVGGQYSQFGRIAASTGLPTVLGWAGHEYQWRGDTPEPGERDPVVTSIYGQPDWPTTELLLDEYGIDYIYVGQLERSTYDPLFEEKFEQNMEVVFRNDTVTIYYRPSQASG
jgi:YYY domain-containing protein